MLIVKWQEMEYSRTFWNILEPSGAFYTFLEHFETFCNFGSFWVIYGIHVLLKYFPIHNPVITLKLFVIIKALFNVCTVTHVKYCLVKIIGIHFFSTHNFWIIHKRKKNKNISWKSGNFSIIICFYHCSMKTP